MDELTQVVFDSAYRSRPQRSLLFSWPLYLLSAVGLALPGEYAWAFLLLLVPAVAVSGLILTNALLFAAGCLSAAMSGMLCLGRDARGFYMKHGWMLFDAFLF